MTSPSTSKWQPQTKKYEYNYGLGINFYQPMIDFLDDKERGVRGRSPHLPWQEEKALRQYDPMNAIKTYSEHELGRLARKTEASAKENLRNIKATSRSCYQLNQSVSAASITEKIEVKKTHKKKRDMLRQIKTVESRYKDFDYDPHADMKVKAELKAEQKYLKGKSAKAIEQQLLAKSRRNIAETIEEDVTKMEQGVVGKSFSFAGHRRLMEDRMCKAVDESFEKPLENLSQELQSFNVRSQHYYYDKR
ncbi:paramyosin, short form-like [Harmonia axyridis]|uniref:paramyosin, short form-like n=1 Tax=Harmonia axyridis TaxID=115357 RepID=UPI001E276204|nr:paramyosin, short form-like [Harmonia axyridis]